MKNVFLILFSILLLTSCVKEEGIAPSIYDLTFNSEGKSYDIKTDNDLSTFAAERLKLKSLNSLKSVYLEEATDSQGDYYLVRGKYFDVKKEVMITFGIPLSFTTSDRTKAATGECTMKCEATDGCVDGCEQTIHERCKRQTCRCSMGGKCNAAMSF